jgi:hypothetical protein
MAAAHPSFIRKTGNYVLTGASTPLFFPPQPLQSSPPPPPFPKEEKQNFQLNILFVKFRALKKNHFIPARTPIIYLF